MPLTRPVPTSAAGHRIPSASPKPSVSSDGPSTRRSQHLHVTHRAIKPANKAIARRDKVTGSRSCSSSRDTVSSSRSRTGAAVSPPAAGRCAREPPAAGHHTKNQLFLHRESCSQNNARQHKPCRCSREQHTGSGIHNLLPRSPRRTGRKTSIRLDHNPRTGHLQRRARKITAPLTIPSCPHLRGGSSNTAPPRTFPNTSTEGI